MGYYRPVHLTSITGKVVEKPGLILEVISKHVKEKKVIKSSQYEFSKDMVLPNLIDFHN